MKYHHGGDFFGSEVPFLPGNLDTDSWFAIFVDDGEREMFDVCLNIFVREFAADQTSE